MRFIKRLTRFINKIGSAEHSKAQNLLNFILFIVSPPGFVFVLKKVVEHGFRKRWRKEAYQKWITTLKAPQRLKAQYESEHSTWTAQPLISIVMPVYNPDVIYLSAAIDSVLEQLYPNWELCIADDVSPNTAVRATLMKYMQQDSRIKVVFREQNGHISECTNSALSLAKGEYYLFMDHDDLLTCDCLYKVVRAVNQHPDADLIYSDEDKINEQGFYSEPHFKPDWAPDNLLSRNYIGHVVVARAGIVQRVGGFRTEYNGSQDYDFLLRVTELTQAIVHIPEVLYHWRIHSQSVAMADNGAKPYAYNAAVRALEAALERRQTPASIQMIPNTSGAYRVFYKQIDNEKISVIIPSKNQAGMLRKAIDSIVRYAAGADFEIIVLDNNSDSQSFKDLVRGYEVALKARFRCIEAKFPFNYSRLMNLGAKHATGKYLLMLNNDVEAMHEGWMQTMVSFAQRVGTGAVGAKLLYADETIQHAGVVLGLGGAAGHVFVKIPAQSQGYFNYPLMLNNYAAVTGACMMCRKDVFLSVNGFDEQLAVECNDVDFCLRLLKKGYYNVFVPDVQLYHHESVTRGHPFHSKRNWQQHEADFTIFKSRWAELIKKDPFYNPNLSVETDDFQLNYKTDWQ